MKRKSLYILLLGVLLFTSLQIAQAQEDDKEESPVLVGAGDIASCVLPGDERTAKLLNEIEGTIFTTGDNAYPDGSVDDFANCYEPSWGAFKHRTRPSPGNHDYKLGKAEAYYSYFGDNAGFPGLGYYSYDLGEWHIISLNSNVDIYPGYSQETWLIKDLEENKTACTLVYWHHPMFVSGQEKYVDRPRDIPNLWKVLYKYGVDVVVNGHVHYYERMAPQDPDGNADPERGIRQFIVGTGGGSLRTILGDPASPNSEIRDNTTHGVIKFTLHPTSYEWEFIPVEGGMFTDKGTADCIVAGSQGAE